MRDLAALPKGHLHLHLEGAMRPGTLADLAAASGVEAPSTRGYTDFGAFLATYSAACAALTTEAALRRLVREVVEDAARDGVAWLEPQFHPSRYATPFGEEAAVDLVLDELAAAGAQLGVGTGLIIAANRTAPPTDALHLAELAAERAGRGVVGFGLANDEAGHPPRPFAEAFAVAADAGLLSVPHGGELEGSDSVRSCLDDLGARRVMHGVRAVEDPALVARLARDGICLDVCPTSNMLLGVVPALAEHPLPQLLAAGVRCSINADDPLLFGPGVLLEYEVCRRELGLDDDAVARAARCSLEDSAAPRELVDRAVAAVDRWLAAPPG